MSTDQLLTPAPAAGHVSAVRLLDAIADMHLAVPESDRERARQVVVAPTRTWPAGPFLAPDRLDRAHPFALVILEGALLSTTRLGDREASEIFGDGDSVDLLAPQAPSELAAPVEFVVREPLTVVVLDDRFRVAARRWPHMHDVLYTRLARQRRASAAHMAMLHLPRVDERILTLFEHLSDRWGCVTPEGIVVRLRLSHNVIGQLVGSRRPTVSLALAELAERGALIRRADNHWLRSAARLGPRGHPDPRTSAS